MGKKLIFCFDGTCNDPKNAGKVEDDTNISNVLNLHARFGGKLAPLNEDNEKTPGQRSFYYSGIGTRGSKIMKVLNTALAPPSWDMKDIIENARADIESHWTSGDEVFVIGFSRGAAIARIFTSLLGDLKINVEFIGVFDTVMASIEEGIDLNLKTFPKAHELDENFVIGTHVKKAVHLVSLDETRIAFQPTLMNKDEKERVSEVWFPGGHSDVGGGFDKDGLSDNALEFMTKEIRTAGVHILDEDEINYDDISAPDEGFSISPHDIKCTPNHRGMMHLKKRPNTNVRPTLGARLLRVNENDYPSKEIPIIHHTVEERMKDDNEYRPASLRGKEYRVMDENGEIGDIKESDFSLPEPYKFPDPDRTSGNR